ncbi:MAG: lysophospholipase L1-like esterase [Myxococcota bacterium]|jgi:lysophospholipase L1-like esterase
MALATTLAALIGVELLFRLALPAVAPDAAVQLSDWRARFAPQWDPSPLFRPHPYLSYVSADLGVNAEGFYGPDRTVTPPPNALRIACLGASTTAGADAWPHQLEGLLSEALPERTVEVFNYGVSGWTTAESLINFAINAQDYQPDVVILHHAANDLGPMERVDFRRDYSHYRRPLSLSVTEQGQMRARQGLTWGIDRSLGRISNLYLWTRIQLAGEVPSRFTLQGLTMLSGQPAPVDAERAAVFVRNIRSIGTLAEASGASMILTTIPHLRTDSRTPEWGAVWVEGMADQHHRLSEIAASTGWPLVDLDAMMHGETERFTDPLHVDKVGNQRKAALLLDAVLERIEP